MTQQINLIEPGLIPARDWCNGRVVVAATGALALAIAAHFAFEKQALTQVLAGSVAAPAEGTASDATLTQLQEGEGKLARSETLMRAARGLADLPADNAARLETLISALPDSLWLQEVEFTRERGVRIVGGATDAAALGGFSRRLGSLAAFRGLPLHVYALEPRAADKGEPLAETEADTARGEARRAPLYGFVLSSIDAERSAGANP